MPTPPKMDKLSEAGRAAFAALVADLQQEVDVVPASMFGMPSIKRRGGKALAGLHGEDMVFKLAGETHTEALALEGAHLFEPMQGRPMQAWVQVPPAHESRWPDLARAAESALES